MANTLPSMLFVVLIVQFFLMKETRERQAGGKGVRKPGTLVQDILLVNGVVQM